MITKKYLIIITIVATMLSADVAAQSFLKKLKEKGEKQLKHATEQIVKESVNDAVESATGKKSSSKKKNVARKAGDSSAQYGTERNKSSFNPGKKKITINLCEGIGVTPPPGMGTVVAASQLPPKTESKSKMNDWLASQTRCYEYTNARVVEEEKKISGVLKTYATDEIYERQMEAENTINQRAKAVEGAVKNLMDMLDERNTNYDSPEDSSEDYYEDRMLDYMGKTEYKVAMRSSLEPLYRYMSQKVTDFLKSVNLKAYTVDVTVFNGGTNIANDVKSGDFWFTVNPGKRTAMLKAYSPKSVAASVVIPSTIEYGNRTFSVTEIWENAFYRQKVSSITLPEKLTKIYGAAFAETAITSINFPSTLTELAEAALCSMPLVKSITIPNSVKKIPHSLVAGCKSLTTVVLPQNVTEMGKGVFQDCIALTSVTLPQNITEIPESTFEGCKSLAKVDIPSSVKKFDQLCFYGCTALKTLPMGENVTEIGWRSFGNCKGLTSIVVPARVNIEMLAFENCTSLRAATIGSQYKDPIMMQDLTGIFSKCPVMPVKPGLNSGYVKFHDK